MLNIFKKVKDMSFGNVFWKNFAIRLIALALVTIIFLFYSNTLVDSLCKSAVESNLNKCSINVAEIVSSEATTNTQTSQIKKELALTQDTLEDLKIFESVALNIYDMDSGTEITNSDHIVITEDETLLDWWETKTGEKYGLPTIKASDDFVEFCIKNSNRKIVVTKICYINGVLMPVKAKSYNDDKITSSFECAEPSFSNAVYEVPCEVILAGGEYDSLSARHLTSKTIEIVEKDVEPDVMMSPEATQSPTAKKEIESINIVYINDKCDVESSVFTINGNEYRIDCAYASSIWSNCLLYFVLFELFAILMCAGISFVSTKMQLSFYD